MQASKPDDGSKGYPHKQESIHKHWFGLGKNKPASDSPRSFEHDNLKSSFKSFDNDKPHSKDNGDSAKDPPLHYPPKDLHGTYSSEMHVASYKEEPQ